MSTPAPETIIATARRDALGDAITRATGCLDYLGGLTGPGDEPLLREYHAGMRCVIGALEKLRDGEDTHQSRAVDAVGAAARLAAAEAEIERLRAALADAEERAAGPFFAECDAVGYSEYGLRLDRVLDELLQQLGARLEEDHGPEEWSATVARWEVTVGHGVHVAPEIDDFGEAELMVTSAVGWWHYDLRLTVTPDGSPVLTAERRAGGTR